MRSLTCRWLKQRTNTRTSVWFVLLSLVFCISAVAASEPGGKFEEEIRIGTEAAEYVAKEYKFVEDPAVVERVESIGNAIAEVALAQEFPASYGKPTLAPFTYSFKVIDGDEVNAFALPAGYVYVYRGLLDFVHSDDELAAIIAHEVAHVAHHHGIQIMKAQEKQMLTLAAALIAGAAVGAEGDSLYALAQVVGIVNMAQTSSYGQEAEFDADRTAVGLLSHTKYNPVGMLTAMERLAREEGRKPQINYGIFANHPPSFKRSGNILEELDRRDIPINRRLVTNYLSVQVKPVEDSTAYAVWLSDIEVVRLADTDDTKALERADAVAEKLNNSLMAGARMHNVKAGPANESIIVGGQVIATPTAKDAAAVGSTIAEVVRSAVNSIKTALLKERLGLTSS